MLGGRALFLSKWVAWLRAGLAGQFFGGVLGVLAVECLVGGIYSHQVPLGRPLAASERKLVPASRCEILPWSLRSPRFTRSLFASIQSVRAPQCIGLSSTLSCLRIWVLLSHERWLLYRESLGAHLLLKTGKCAF